MSEEENILYNKTQEFGRTQFVRELLRLQQENKELKEELKKERNKILKALEYIEKKWYSLNTTNIDEVFSLGNWKVDLCNLLKGE